MPCAWIPIGKPTQCALMEALAALGDRAGMTLAYRQFRLLLHEELQTEPSAETKALYLRLREEGRQTKPQDVSGFRLTRPNTPITAHSPAHFGAGRPERGERGSGGAAFERPVGDADRNRRRWENATGAGGGRKGRVPVFATASGL